METSRVSELLNMSQGRITIFQTHWFLIHHPARPLSEGLPTSIPITLVSHPRPQSKETDEITIQDIRISLGIDPHSSLLAVCRLVEVYNAQHIRDGSFYMLKRKYNVVQKRGIKSDVRWFLHHLYGVSNFFEGAHKYRQFLRSTLKTSGSDDNTWLKRQIITWP